MQVPLPLGVPHFFLSSAFGSSAFLMLAHTKGDPLDGLVHRLLGYCMTAVAVTVLAQGVVGRRSYGLDAAKSLALIMQVSEQPAQSDCSAVTFVMFQLAGCPAGLLVPRHQPHHVLTFISL